MKRWLVLGMVTLLLASCVPAPQPFRSPDLFRSPLPPPAKRYRYFVPLVLGVPSKVGVSMDLAYRSCVYPAQVGAMWYYDWSPQPLQCAGLEAVPMLWAPGDGVTNPPGPSAYLLLLNECDRPDQCNVDPETAARAWRQWEQQYPDRKLVGPNTSNAGMAWLLAWHSAYRRIYGESPRMWALGIHCYKDAAWCQDWITANIALARQWTTSGKVWLTEWAMPLPEADGFLSWLLANPGVEREAWFLARGQVAGWPLSELVDKRGALTELGIWHRSVVSPR